MLLVFYHRVYIRPTNSNRAITTNTHGRDLGVKEPLSRCWAAAAAAANAAADKPAAATGGRFMAAVD